MAFSLVLADTIYSKRKRAMVKRSEITEKKDAQFSDYTRARTAASRMHEEGVKCNVVRDSDVVPRVTDR